jgi:rubrerythrin
MSVKDALLASLKDGMKAEMDSVTLYKSAAMNSQDKQVKDFFMERVAEEQLHYNYLLSYFHQVSKNEEPSETWGIEPHEHQIISPVISDEFIERIGESQVLFSAISTAVLLEKNAIDFYKKCQADTESQTLKKFFAMLVDWETKHYNDVLNIQKDAEVVYWRMNRFEPF